jgi:hypothetical protein
MKPFRVLLAEQDTDYVYKLCSVENIQDTYIMDRVRLALGRYGLISMESLGVNLKISSSEDSIFPSYPFLPVYVLKIVMANPLTSRNAIQSIALFASIPQDTLRFFDMKDQLVMDGAETEQHAHPVEVDSAFAQSEVGDARAKSLVSDMMKQISSSRSGTLSIPVYESSMVTHHEVNRMIGQRVSRGYYLVEKDTNGRGQITGPFARSADNLSFMENVSPVTLVKTNKVGDMMEFVVNHFPPDSQGDPADAGRRAEHKPMEVVLIDQDTGKEYTVVVRASSEETARSSAVEILSKETGIIKGRLLPKSPTAV